MSENNISQMKKKNNKKLGKIISMVISICLLIGFGLYGYKQYNQKQEDKLAKAQDIKYEVLDESVLSTDVLKEWVDENKKAEGVYSNSDDEYTYILIAGGKKDTTGYGISLEKLNGDMKNIGVQYKVISPENPNIIENEESYPNMVIRLPKDTRNIKEELLKEDENEVQKIEGTKISPDEIMTQYGTDEEVTVD